MRMRVLILAVALLVVGGTLRASTYGTVDMTYINDDYYAPGQTPGVDVGQAALTAQITNGPADAAAVGYYVYVGRSNFKVNATTGAGSWPTPSDGSFIVASCVDIYQFIGSNHRDIWQVTDLGEAPYPGGAAGPMNGVKASLLAELTDRYSSAANSAVNSAAFQAAVWEIVNEPLLSNPNPATDYSLETGAFQMANWSNNQGAVQADLWLQSLTLPGADTTLSFGLLHHDTQDFGYIIPGAYAPPDDPPVPEPVTMFSALAAMSSLSVYIRRRVKAPAAA